MKKPRSDSRLFQLTEAQQAKIYEWLLKIGYEATKEKIAKPVPEGFEVKTHITSLRRFFLHYSDMAKERAFFRSLVTNDGEINPDLERAIEQAEAHLAFELVCSPPSLETFNAVSRWLNRR